MQEITLEEELDLVLGPINAQTTPDEIASEARPAAITGPADPGSEDEDGESAEDDQDTLDED